MKNALTLLICLFFFSFLSFAQPPVAEAIKSFDEKNPWPGGHSTAGRPLFDPASSGYDAYGDPPQWEWVQKMGGDGQDRVNWSGSKPWKASTSG